jgi:hypothetical protein
MNELITNWQGEDYINFVQEYADQRTKFVNKKGVEWLTMTGGSQSVDKADWREVINTVKFEFRHEDLVLNKGLDASVWLDNVPGTIVHVSHIFNYDPASTFLPLRHRIYNEKVLMNKITKQCPSATVITVDETISDIFTNNLPTWHQNGEWNI